MKNTYILDTSALVTDPSCYKSFPDSDIIIPIIVLGELDKLKKQSGEIGRKARVCIRLIDEVSETGNINKVINLDSNILLKVDSTYRDLNKEPYSHLGDPGYGDTSILACAIDYLKELKEGVVLVSNDLNLKIKAKGHGLEARSHEAGNLSMTDLFGGHQTIVDEDAGLDLQQFSSLDLVEYDLPALRPNECVSFEDEQGNTVALGRMGKEFVKPLSKKSYPWELSARNKEQSFAIDLIMDRNIDLVTLIGKAGTGKSYLALGYLFYLLDKGKIDKIVIFCNTIATMNSAKLGFYPGSKDEKLMDSSIGNMLSAKFGGEKMFPFAVHLVSNGAAVGVAQRGLERLGEALADVVAHLEAVDDDVDGVLLRLGELGQRVDLVDRAVHAQAGESLCTQFGEEVLLLALAVGDDRRKDHQLGVGGQSQHMVDHLRDGLRIQRLLVLRAIRRTGAGE